MAINWEVEIGFNGKKVEEGLKDLERRFERLSIQQSKISKSTQTLEAKLAVDRQRAELRSAGLVAASKLRMEEFAFKEKEKQAAWQLREDRKRQDRNEREAQMRLRAIQREENAKKRASVAANRGNLASLIPKTSLTPITNAGRRGLDNTIEKTINQASIAQSRIKERTDQKSLEVKMRLREEINKLIAVHERMKTVTYSNSAAYDSLARQLNDSKNAISQLNAKSKEINKQFTVSKFATDGATASIKNLARSYVSVFAVISGFRGMTRIGADLEDTRAVMLLASGDAKLAAEDMAYIGELSDKTSMRVADLARSFAKFAVAGRGAGLTTSQVRETFDDLSVTLRATGLSQDRANLAMLGLQQMLAGPVVQGQEMNQVIEQLPQFSKHATAALRQMGFEADNYRNAIATGTVNSKEFVTLVSRSMREEAMNTGAFAEAMDTVTAATGEFRNAIDAMVDSIFEAGMADTLTAILKGMGNTIRAVTPLFTSLVYVINGFVSVISGAFSYMGEFVELLGFKEGTGVAWVLRLLGIILAAYTLPAMATFISSAAKSATAAYNWALGLNAVAAASNKAKWAIRGLMAATGVGAVLAVAGMAAEALMVTGSNASQSATYRDDPMGAMKAYANNQASATPIQQVFHITQSSDPMEHARRSHQAFMNEMTG